MKTVLFALLVSIAFISCSKESIIEDNNCVGCYTNSVCGEIISIQLKDPLNPSSTCNSITIVKSDNTAYVSKCQNEDISNYSIGDSWCGI